MADKGLNAKSTFEAFAKHGKSGQKVEGMDNKNFSKCCKDCKIIDGKKVTSTDVDITFSKYKTKGARTITYDQFEKAVLDLGSKRFGPDELVDKLRNLLTPDKVANAGVTKTSKTGGVDKMTDASQYTGSHKERFDASGKGKGMEGRKDLVENTGYVGDYKGQGTYEKKVGN